MVQNNVLKAYMVEYQWLAWMYTIAASVDK